MTLPRHRLTAFGGLSALVLTLLLVLTDGGGAQAQDAEPAGRTLFLQHCAGCHGADGRGTLRGPELTGDGAAAAHFQISTGRMPPPASERRPERVPPVDFSEPAARAVARYVGRIAGGPDIPSVDLADAELSRGAELYLQACAACHGSTGVGGVLTSGDAAPPLGDLTPVQIAEAIITGPGEMPQFALEEFDARERDAIVRYVEQVIDVPRDRGGLGLGHFGPFVEGLVALLVGLPLLLLVAHHLGRSADRRVAQQEGDEDR